MKPITTKIILDEQGNRAVEFTDEQLESLDMEVGDTIVWEESADPYIMRFHKKTPRIQGTTVWP